jgi:hypothetical protein
MRYVSLFSLSATREQNGSGFSSIDVGADYCQVDDGDAGHEGCATALHKSARLFWSFLLRLTTIGHVAQVAACHPGNRDCRHQFSPARAATRAPASTGAEVAEDILIPLS